MNLKKIPCCERDTDFDGNCDRHPDGLAYELNANEEQVFKMLVEQFGKHEVCAAELVKNNPHVVAAGMEVQLKPLYEQVQQGADAVLAVCLKLDEIDQKAIQAAANFKPQVTDL